MEFFDPNRQSSAQFAMGGLGHVSLVVLMFALLAVMIVLRKQLPALRRRRTFMAGTAAFVLGIELLSYVFKFTYPCVPAYERIPLHLCASLKLLITTLILLERYDLVKYVSIWAIGCGFISFVNLNLGGGSFENFMFWHYLLGHYYLFLIPIFLFLTGDFRYDLKFQGLSSAMLLGWSLVVFIVNWAFDTNYMYTGPHNTTAVPMVPAGLMVWPMNYVSYVVIGLVLLGAVYGILRAFQPLDSRDSSGAAR